LGFTVVDPGREPGEHILADPDGRIVVLVAVAPTAPVGRLDAVPNMSPSCGRPRSRAPS
jgi:hypothetical protein